MDEAIGARNALKYVLEGVAGERLAIVCDEEKRAVGTTFAHAAVDLGLWVRLFLAPTSTRYRTDVSPALREYIIGQRPDIFLNLFRGPAEEVSFRIAVTALETRRRVRLGHCPGITLDMLTDGALALRENDYEAMHARVEQILQRLQDVVRVTVTNPEGTALRFGVKDRPFFTDTKVNWKTMKWMNLPVGEVIVGPEETSMNGTLVCSTAVGGIGLLDAPVTVEVADGKVVSLRGDAREQVEKIEENLAIDDWASFVGEFAFGLNPKARMLDEFLETEKVEKTVHVAFGNNIDYPGGCNPSANHMDFLITEPTVEVEYSAGERTCVMRDGEFTF